MEAVGLENVSETTQKPSRDDIAAIAVAIVAVRGRILSLYN